MNQLSNDSPAIRRLKLVAAMAAIMIFIFVLAPLGMRIPAFKALTTVAEERGIEVTAFYYTGVTAVGEAEINCRSSVAFANK